MNNKNITNTKKLFLVLAFFSLSLITVQIFIEKIYSEKQFQKAALNNAYKKLFEREDVLKNFLDDSEDVLYSLYKLNQFQQYLHNRSEKEKVENIFLGYAQSNPDFLQLRYIDKTGLEQIRIDRSTYNDRPKIVPKNELQNKSKRYYFSRSKSKPFNKVWFSAIDLNIEYGKLQTPHTPTLRAIFPIESNNQFDGILVINYLMEEFLKVYTNTPLYDIILCDSNGYTIHHHGDDISNQNKKSWGNSTEHKYNIKTEFPNEYKNILQNNIYKSEKLVSKKLEVPIMDGLYLIFQLKQSYILDEKKQLAIKILISSILIILFSMVFAYFLSKYYGKKLLNLGLLENKSKELEDAISELNYEQKNLKQAQRIASIGALGT